MPTSHPAGAFRLIGWNSIQLALPANWETIVSGDRNLLVEHNFQPLIELRWEQDTSQRELAEVFLSIQNALGKRSKSPVEQVELPAELADLAAQNQCIAFSWSAVDGPLCSDRKQKINGVLWRCSRCQTIIICQLYKHPEIDLDELASVLSSIHCHQDDADANSSTYWSIQDIQLTLPASCKMSAHSFQAGLTKLTFEDSGVQLHFCRLAPARQRLQQGPMSRLLLSLLGEDADYLDISTSSHLYECISSPPLPQQMLKRLKRQYPFRWGRIWHDEGANRLLSVIAESSNPIDLDKVYNFCENYEIIPPKKEQTKHHSAQTEPG